jgi:hypothetical protein
MRFRLVFVFGSVRIWVFLLVEVSEGVVHFTVFCLGEYIRITVENLWGSGFRYLICSDMQ